MNHQYITPELITALTPDEQKKLATWYFAQVKHDDDIVHIFLPEEEDGPYAGIFEGSYDAEYEFGYPEDYTGSLMHHEGTMLPLLSIGEMIAFLTEKPLFSKRPDTIMRRGMDDKIVWIIQTPAKYYIGEELVQALWDCVKGALRP